MHIVLGTSVNYVVTIPYENPTFSKVIVDDYRPGISGSTVNIAETVRSLCQGLDVVDANLTLVGAVGIDSFGRELITEVSRRGYTSGILPIRQRTSLALVGVNTSRGKTVAIGAKPPYNPDANMGPYLRHLQQAIRASDPRYCVLSGIHPYEEELEIARVIFGATNPDAHHNVLLPSGPLLEHAPKAFMDLVAQTRTMFLNDEEARYILDEPCTKENISRLHELGPVTIIVTQNSSGMLISDRSEEPYRIWHQHAHLIPPDKHRNNRGAGDALLGAWLVGRLKRWSRERTFDFAAATAAVTVTYLEEGHVPTYSEVEQVMKHQPCESAN